MFNNFFFENRVVYDSHAGYTHTHTHTHTEYAIVLAFQQLKFLCEPTPLLRLYVLYRFHPFGTACSHVIVLPVVLSTLPPLPSILVEPSL